MIEIDDEAAEAAEELRQEILRDTMRSFWRHLFWVVLLQTLICFAIALPSIGTPWFWLIWLIGPVVALVLQLTFGLPHAKMKAEVVFLTVMQDARRREWVKQLTGQE